MATQKRTYTATLWGRGGELDMFSADDMETLSRHLGKRLLSRDWILREGDDIQIREHLLPVEAA